MDHVNWKTVFFFFLIFFKVRLPHHPSFLEDVLNNGFREICIKITNDLETGLNCT